MELVFAPDIKKQLAKIQRRLNLENIDLSRIICFRSYKSQSRARARIWAFPKIWQLALNLKPYYCIEVLAEKFDHLPSGEQTKILIHELLHIPKNFSGSLHPHGSKKTYLVNQNRVKLLYDQYCSR